MTHDLAAILAGFDRDFIEQSPGYGIFTAEGTRVLAFSAFTMNGRTCRESAEADFLHYSDTHAGVYELRALPHYPSLIDAVPLMTAEYGIGVVTENAR